MEGCLLEGNKSGTQKTSQQSSHRRHIHVKPRVSQPSKTTTGYHTFLDPINITTETRSNVPHLPVHLLPPSGSMPVR
jgi:hypothetical protein